MSVDASLTSSCDKNTVVRTYGRVFRNTESLCICHETAVGIVPEVVELVRAGCGGAAEFRSDMRWRSTPVLNSCFAETRVTLSSHCQRYFPQRRRKYVATAVRKTGGHASDAHLRPIALGI